MNTEAIAPPAGIAQLPEPCWEIPGEDAHYDDPDQARDMHDGAEPVHLTDRCWIAKAACGRTVETDEFPVSHFLTIEDALSEAVTADWSVIDGVLRCEDGDLCEATP